MNSHEMDSHELGYPLSGDKSGTSILNTHVLRRQEVVKGARE